MQILFRHLSPMNIPTLPLNFLLDPASVQEKHSRPTRAGSGLYEDLPVLTLPVSSFSSSMIVCVCVWVVGGWLKGKWQRLGHEQGSVSRLALFVACPMLGFLCALPCRHAIGGCKSGDGNGCGQERMHGHSRIRAAGWGWGCGTASCKTHIDLLGHEGAS